LNILLAGGIPLAGVRAANGKRSLRAGVHHTTDFMIYRYPAPSQKIATTHSHQVFTTFLTDEIPTNKERKEEQLTK